MDNTTTHQPYPPIRPAPEKPHTVRKTMLITTGALAILGIGIGVGSAAHTPAKPVTRTVAGPAVPGPTVTVPGPTVTASPPAPAAGAKIGSWSGSGDEVTPAFNVPGNGDYIVTWQYSGNSDSYGGSNFTIDNTGSGLGMDLPNDIAGSGHGSTEITGASGTDRFNVQSLPACSWTISVKAA